MPMPTANGEKLDSERFKTSKTDCVLKVYKDSFISLDSRFVDLENSR